MHIINLHAQNENNKINVVIYIVKIQLWFRIGSCASQCVLVNQLYPLADLCMYIMRKVYFDA